MRRSFSVLLLLVLAFRLPAQEEVYEPGSDILSPELVHLVKPEMTVEAKAAKVSGAVRVSVIVNPLGEATQVKLLSGLGFGLDESALKAVENWRFRPGTKDGRKVNVRLKISVRFVWDQSS